MSFIKKLQGRFAQKGLSAVVRPENLKQRKLTPKHSGTVATAQEFEFDLNSKKLIHAIIISIGESDVASGDTEQGTLVDDALSIQLTSPQGDLKYMTAAMNKALGIACDGVALGTGIYKLTFSDPSIPDAMPLPAWIFDPLLLKIVDNAPAALNYHHVRVSVVESNVPAGIDITNWRILYERYLKTEAYGTNTGYQQYKHSLSRFVYGYLYAVDDDGTLSDTEFDRLKLVGEKPVGDHTIFDEQWMPHIKQLNTMENGVAMPTGFFNLEFPVGFDTGQYKELSSWVNIPTAATNARLTVLERYLL